MQRADRTGFRRRAFFDEEEEARFSLGRVPRPFSVSGAPRYVSTQQVAEKLHFPQRSAAAEGDEEEEKDPIGSGFLHSADEIHPAQIAATGVEVRLPFGMRRGWKRVRVRDEH